MPAYAFRVAEPQENREELERQLTQEVRECTEVRITERNHVKRCGSCRRWIIHYASCLKNI